MWSSWVSCPAPAEVSSCIYLCRWDLSVFSFHMDRIIWHLLFCTSVLSFSFMVLGFFYAVAYLSKIFLFDALYTPLYKYIESILQLINSCVLFWVWTNRSKTHIVPNTWFYLFLCQKLFAEEVAACLLTWGSFHFKHSRSGLKPYYWEIRVSNSSGLYQCKNQKSHILGILFLPCKVGGLVPYTRHKGKERRPGKELTWFESSSVPYCERCIAVYS